LHTNAKSIAMAWKPLPELFKATCIMAELMHGDRKNVNITCPFYHFQKKNTKQLICLGSIQMEILWICLQFGCMLYNMYVVASRRCWSMAFN